MRRKLQLWLLANELLEWDDCMPELPRQGCLVPTAFVLHGQLLSLA
eukprot:SAG22_NODE_13770_length_395_cov_1.037162_1_plen_45_part_10